MSIYTNYIIELNKLVFHCISNEEYVPVEDIIRCRRPRWLGHLSRMDHHRLLRQALTWESEGFRRGQVDRYRTGKMSRKISGKWASAGMRLKRLWRRGGAEGIVSPNASLTWDEPSNNEYVPVEHRY